jgi:hypothetical protein
MKENNDNNKKNKEKNSTTIRSDKGPSVRKMCNVRIVNSPFQAKCVYVHFLYTIFRFVKQSISSSFSVFLFLNSILPSFWAHS